MIEVHAVSDINPEQIRPGTDFQLPDFTALHAFEELVAPKVNPDYDQARWSGRRMLSYLQPKETELIGGLELTTLDAPMQEFRDSARDSWIFRPAVASVTRLKFGYTALAFHLGATFQALEGNRQTRLDAKIWYIPRRQITTASMHSGIVQLVGHPNSNRVRRRKDTDER